MVTLTRPYNPWNIPTEVQTSIIEDYRHSIEPEVCPERIVMTHVLCSDEYGAAHSLPGVQTLNVNDSKINHKTDEKPSQDDCSIFFLFFSGVDVFRTHSRPITSLSVH